MALTLVKLAANVASVDVEWGDETVKVEYFPGKVTEKVFAKLNALSHLDESTLEKAFSGFNEALASIIKSWNIFEDAKETIRFPVEAERFPELPIDLRVAILQTILGDVRPNSPTPQGKTSN